MVGASCTNWSLGTVCDSKAVGSRPCIRFFSSTLGTFKLADASCECWPWASLTFGASWNDLSAPCAKITEFAGFTS